MKKRFISILLCLTLLTSSFACLSGITVNAATGADVIAIARSQKGYHGRPNTFSNWMGVPYGEWCAAFACWCAEQAGIPKDVVPKIVSSTSLLVWYNNIGRWHRKNGTSWSYGGKTDNSAVDYSYIPQAGDIILVDTNSDYTDGPDHTALVTGYSNGVVYTIEGNITVNGTSNMVAENSYSASSSRIWGYCNPAYTVNLLDTSNPIDLGTNFYAQIVNVKSGKNLAVNLENNNVLIYQRMLNDDHIWKFDRYSDGSYKITNMLNGKVLDIDSASSSAGANVHLWDSNGSAAQKWFIYKYNGKYALKAKCTDCVLDIANGSTDNCANAQTYTFNGTDAQLYNIDILGNDLGSNFDAYIYGTTTYKPITADSNNNVVLNTEKGDGSEIWHFAKNSNGSYTISNKAGKCLDVDSAIDANEINVDVYESNGTNAQKWFVCGSDGGYKLKPVCALGRAMDIWCNAVDDGTNIQIYDSVAGNQAAQSFQITKIGEDIGTDFYANIQGVSSGKMLSTQVNNNVAIRMATGCDDQLWKFERQADKSYKIINMSTGYVLDVYGGWAGNGVNVQTYASNNSKAQRWFVYKQGEGYRLGNKATYCVIDIDSNLTDDETNAQMYTSNGTNAQTFKINKVDNPNLAQNLGNDFYAYIKTKQDPMLRITSTSGNAVLKSDLMRSTRYWHFVKQTDGTYRIISVAEGKCLDVEGYGTANGTNVIVCAEHDDSVLYDKSNQNWYIYEDRGAYVIKSKASGKVLDVSEGKFEYGTNIQIWQKDSAVPNQLFTIDKPSASVIAEDGIATISWEDFYNGDDSTESFTIKIYQDLYGSTEEPYKVITADGSATSTETELEPGDYELKVSTVVGNNTYRTDAVAFTVTSKEINYLIGDVDLDGIVTVKDATKLQQLIVRSGVFDADMKYVCDTTRDNIVNVNDVTRIQCYCAMIINEF